VRFGTVCVVGAGRVGKAVAERLAERIPTRVAGRELQCGDAELILLCVPDRAIVEIAPRIPVGPWIAHTSGACRLEALSPHACRFSLHPLQTFTLERGPEQLDGAWAAVSGADAEAEATGFELARLLGLEPFNLADEHRPLYHAGATMAASFLVTLHSAAAELFAAADAPTAALEPLMRRTIENGFAPTGPHVRGDWTTVEGHLEAIREHRPALEPLYRLLSDSTAEAVAS
jgi:predicted short-subunit dehydrogenase-like oxidoreductase (DUF2520 family)